MKTVELIKTLHGYVEVPDDWEWDGTMRSLFDLDELPAWVGLFHVDSATVVRS